MRIRSIARLGPISRGSRTVPPSISGTPQRRQNTPNTAVSSATRRSHHSASSSPPATACPATAAITGLDSRSRVGPIGPSPSGSMRLPRSVAIAREVGARAERAAGAVQDGDGGVVVGVERPERVGQRGAVGPSTALRRAGRSRVTVVTGPSRSTWTLIALPRFPSLRSPLLRPPSLRSPPATTQRRTELRRHVGEDLHVVLVLEGERQRPDHLAHVPERGVRVQRLRDLVRGPDEVPGVEHPARPVGNGGARRPVLDVGGVARLLVRGRGVGGDDDEALRHPGRLAERVHRPEELDLLVLDPGEDPRRVVAEVVALGLDHVAREHREALLAGPAHRAPAAAAVPDAVGEAAGERLDVVGERLDPVDAGERARGLAAQQAQEAFDAGVAEVLDVGRVGVEPGLDVVPVDGRPDADPRVHAPAGEDVQGAEVLGVAQRVLPAQGRHGGTELDPGGPLRGGREHRHRRRDAGLEVAVAQPDRVEPELLAQDDLGEQVLVARAGVGAVVGAEGQETLPFQGDTGRWHTAIMPPAAPLHPSAGPSLVAMSVRICT